MKKSFLLSLLFVATFTYCKAQQKPYKMIKQFYDTTNTWVDSVELLMWYDSSGLLVRQTRKDIFTSPNKFYEIDSIEYTSFGERKRVSRHFWDTLTKTWSTTPAFIYRYIYNTDSLLIKIEQGKNDGDYYDSFVYNSSKQLDQSFLYLTPNTGELRRFKNIYNSKGEVERVLGQVLKAGVWKDLSKTENTYNSSSYLLSTEQEYRNFTTDPFKYSFKNEYVYNTSNQLTEHKWYIYNAGAWFPASNSVRTYNNDGSLDELNMKRKFSAGTWSNRDGDPKFIYYYKGGSTGLPEVADYSFKIYPNPTSGKFTVELEGNTSSTINITDITGKLVFASKASDILDIDLSHLQKGVYIVNVQANNGVKTQKVIVQ